MAREEPQINIRLPADLKDQLDAAAAANRRSLTAEVVARLQQSFVTVAKVGDVFPEAMKSFADEIEERMIRAFATEIKKASAAQQLELPGLPQPPDLFNQSGPEAIGAGPVALPRSTDAAIIRREPEAKPPAESKGPVSRKKYPKKA